MKLCIYPILLFYIIACNLSGGTPGMSENIRESKEREVFICMYEANPKSVIVKDTSKFKVDVAWLEKRWAYSSNLNNTIITNGYQLILHSVARMDEDYSFTWSIGTDFKRYFRSCGYTCLITDFDSLPKEIESWKIQQGRDLYDGAPHKIIGEFTLYKKQF